MNLKLATHGEVCTYLAFMIIMPLYLVKVLLSARTSSFVSPPPPTVLQVHIGEHAYESIMML